VDRLVEVLVSLGAPSNSSSRRAENDASERAAEGEGGGPERANFKSPAIVVVYGITVRRVTALPLNGVVGVEPWTGGARSDKVLVTTATVV
jgi:hypothetical protein